MNEMTPLEVDEITPERAAHSAEILSEMQLNTPPVDNDVIALEDGVTALRRVASGEYASVVHGHWIEDGETQICSNCGEEHEWLDYRATYCDTCGALMDGKDGNDDGSYACGSPELDKVNPCGNEECGDKEEQAEYGGIVSR